MAQQLKINLTATPIIENSQNWILTYIIRKFKFLLCKIGFDLESYFWRSFTHKHKILIPMGLTIMENTLSPTSTAQKMKFFIKNFFSKREQVRGFLTFTEEILNGKLHFLCSLACIMWKYRSYRYETSLMIILNWQAVFNTCFFNQSFCEINHKKLLPRISLLLNWFFVEKSVLFFHI